MVSLLVFAGMRPSFWTDLPNWLRGRFDDNQRYTILCVLVGVLSGLAAVSFHLAIDFVFEHLIEVAGHPGAGEISLVLLFGPAIGGLIVGLILQYVAPRAGGSGIPQTKIAYHNDFGEISLKEGFWRFVAGTVSVGSGNSLGREGPTVHICSAIASAVGRTFGLAKRRVQAMIPIGMGAGIAAAFNTPLAAITFVFEELLDDFSSKALGAILITVVIAAVVERSILGENPVFTMDRSATFTTSFWMLVAIPLGLAAAVLGHLFVGALLWLRARFKESPLPSFLRPAAGGLMVGITGITVLYFTGKLGIYSIGYDDLSASLLGLHNWEIILVLLVGKFIATIFAYASGGSGGIFAPVLFVGSMLGGLFGVVCVDGFGAAENVRAACALLGMGAFFAAVIRCPLTSILIIFEMTLNYTLILPLMVGNMIAFAVSARLRSVPIYDALLLQDRFSLKKLPTYRGEQDWRNLPVSAIMTHDPVYVLREDSIRTTLKKIADGGLIHHGYPVLDPSGKLAGVVCHHELEECVAGRGDEPVGAILNPRAIIRVFPDTSIRDTANTLVVEDVLQAPVVSKKDSSKLVGIVTLHDIARQQNAISESIDR